MDEYGNPVMNLYIRKVERKGGKLVNTVVKTYPQMGQFWTYDPKAFLASPVYFRATTRRFEEPGAVGNGRAVGQAGDVGCTHRQSGTGGTACIARQP